MKKLFTLKTVFAFVVSSALLTACTGDTAVNKTANQNQSSTANIVTVDNSSPTTTSAPVKNFSVDFKSEPSEIKAGTPVTFSFTVKDKTGAVVKDLSIVHEKPMHLMVVSRDLAEFNHIHPEVQADGSYRVSHTFTNGGEYKLYADFTPKESTQVIEKIDVKVAGAERAKVELVPDQKLEKTVEGLRVTMKPSAEIKAGEELMLNFQAFDAASGKPVNDLQNYLGALAHFVIISEDMKDFVHAHPMSKDEAAGDMGGMKMDKAEVADESKPHTHSRDGESVPLASAAGKAGASVSEVSAHTAFPRSGLYKLWAQFQRGGKVITVPFVVKVAESSKATAENKMNVPEGATGVKVSSGGFEPSTVSLKKGQPVKLAFYRADANNCAGEIVFDKQNIRKKLPVGETVLVEFTPTEAGNISFACGMGMMKGNVLVTE